MKAVSVKYRNVTDSLTVIAMSAGKIYYHKQKPFGIICTIHP